MKIVYDSIAGFEKPFMVEEYTPTDSYMFGEQDPFSENYGYGKPPTMHVTKLSAQDVLSVDWDRMAADPKFKNTHRLDSKPSPSRIEFCGGTHEDMLARRYGWKDGVTQVQQAIQQMLPDGIHALRPRPHWSEDGYDIDLDRWRDGHDRPFLSRTLMKGTRNISIGFKYCENCDVSKDSLFRRGAAVLAAVDSLETLGFRVDLTGFGADINLYPDARPGGLSIYMIEVKRASEPADLDYLASTVTSPLMFRGNMFGFWIGNTLRPASGLGHAVQVPKCLHPDIMVNDLPDSDEEAKLLYDRIMHEAIEKTSRKFLTHGQEPVTIEADGDTVRW